MFVQNSDKMTSNMQCGILIWTLCTGIWSLSNKLIKIAISEYYQEKNNIKTVAICKTKMKKTHIKFCFIFKLQRNILYIVKDTHLHSQVKGELCKITEWQLTN